MILILLVNMQQRKYRHGNRKKKAVLVIGSLYLTIYILVILTGTTGLPAWTEWIALAIGLILFIIFRKTCFPFKRKCQNCGKKLTFDEWLGMDDNICMDCYYEKHPEEKKKEDRKLANLTDQQIRQLRSAEATSLHLATAKKCNRTLHKQLKSFIEFHKEMTQSDMM